MALLPKLRQEIGRHRGLRSMVTARELAKRLGIEDPRERIVRELVARLVDGGVPVAGLNFNPRKARGGGGFFLVATEFELRLAESNLHSRARLISDRAAKLRRAFYGGGSRQSSLFGEAAA